MTRKDYELIAAAIKSADSDTCNALHLLESAEIALAIYSRHIADALAADNPRFDRARFRRACGVED